MKNLEFKELSARELREVNGGLWPFIGALIIGLLVGELNDRNAAQDFADGRQAFKDSH